MAENFYWTKKDDQRYGAEIRQPGNLQSPGTMRFRAEPGTTD